ncbi:hypothetical protein KUV85_04995 [Nocardioides panacisoli]|uniref:hypothetical protein n=1 Tax=Nocardioides panacisoli TaxID=627624 RepID=UPI001C63826C|nr:hypothetical protein [Nocardioides panacisoli]QYJ05045.1 hypothetical protein KUV85_04995 [Nocardioides panacisoli]
MFWLYVGIVVAVVYGGIWLLDRRWARRRTYVHGGHLHARDRTVGKWYFQALLGPGDADPHTAAELDRKKETD